MIFRFFLALAVLPLSFAASPKLGQPGPDPAAAEVTLRPGDRLRFSLAEDADVTAELTVGSSGKLDIPYAGLVPAVGRTIEQVAMDVKSALELDYYVKASVRLTLIERPEKSGTRGRVFLSGQVRRVGAVEIDLAEKNTAGQVILSSGGLSEFADARKIKIIRRGAPGAEPIVLSVNLQEVLQQGRIDKDIPLFDGDFVIVDSKIINW